MKKDRTCDNNCSVVCGECQIMYKNYLEQELSKFIKNEIDPKCISYDNKEYTVVTNVAKFSFRHGYNLANEKFEKAKELLEYFVKRVEEGSIKSKTTYKLYKEFLENN